MTLLLFAAAVPYAPAQESKPTIRHHRVEETAPEDPNAVLIDQAEAAMQHDDFATAEATLQKVVAAKPDDYRAWFDLGYVYNATQRRTDAINAYRKAVAAKPDVFESNLNLGLLLAKQGDNAEAAKYLKAATQLKPSEKPEQGLSRAWQALGRVEESSDPQLALVAYEEAGKAHAARSRAAHCCRTIACATKQSGRSGAGISGGYWPGSDFHYGHVGSGERSYRAEEVLGCRGGTEQIADGESTERFSTAAACARLICRREERRGGAGVESGRTGESR